MSANTYDELDNLIRNSGMKYEAIARKMGISTQRLYTMRINPMSMDIEQMESLAKAIQVSFNDIYAVRKNFREKVS